MAGVFYIQTVHVKVIGNNVAKDSFFNKDMGFGGMAFIIAGNTFKKGIGIIMSGDGNIFRHDLFTDIIDGKGGLMLANIIGFERMPEQFMKNNGAIACIQNNGNFSGDPNRFTMYMVFDNFFNSLTESALIKLWGCYGAFSDFDELTVVF